MDISDQATHHEELMREIALRAACSHAKRDYPTEICTGCQYPSKSNWGAACEAWADCLQDLQKRERAGR